MRNMKSTESKILRPKIFVEKVIYQRLGEFRGFDWALVKILNLAL